MTQPSVSQHIQALEQLFDLPLFVRSGRRLDLTDAGESLMPLAQEFVLLSNHIEETMQSLKGEVYGRLRIGCSTTSGKYVLPLLLAGFLRQHPRVEATCDVTSRQLAVQKLCDGEVHLALASKSEFCENAEFREFFHDPVILIAPLDHPWAGRELIEPADLLEAEFILREEGSGTRAVAARGLQQLGIAMSDLRTSLTLGSSEAIALAVQEGIGVGFVSQALFLRLVQGKVAPICVNGLSMQQVIYIGRYMGRPATAAQTAFWRFATDPHNLVMRKS